MTAPLQKTKNSVSTIYSFIQTVQNNIDLDIRFLKGVNINQKDKFGFTAMYWAVYHSNLHNIKILLQFGSKLKVSKDGMNALFCAVFYNKMEVLRFFIEKGFEPSMKYNGLTLIEYAQKFKRTKMVAYLKKA